MTFDAVRLIDTKREGGELSSDDIHGLVAAYLADEVADAQMAALFMAGLLQGFSDDEAIALTDAYVSSGEVVDLGALHGPTVDKHSTGGVGDTTTFVVGPIVAACGLQLAKLSGRGLGHTGGTLDKLEAIPGLRIDLTPDEVARQVNEIGLAVVAATTTLAPADKRTYALRDVTGTVGSRALIAASIMSKKIAGGADHIVLDVKSGDGAFLADAQAARALAELCLRIGRARGRTMSALLSDMSQPLGPAIGNALEVVAALDVLRGEAAGPLQEVSLALASLLLSSTGASDADAMARRALEDGSALESFARMIAAQGGDASVVEDPRGVLPRARCQEPVVAAEGGEVVEVGCRRLGEIAVRLGAGRLRQSDPVDPAVGIVLSVRVGDQVQRGDTLALVHAADPDAAIAARDAVGQQIQLGVSAPERPSVLGVLPS